MWTLARDDSVTPGVAFLIPPGPTRGPRRIARPGFPLWIPHCAGSSQASFCPCTLPWVSVPGELTLGLPRYLFGGLPPQRNRPPTAVPELSSGKRYGPQRAVSHGRLHRPRRAGFDASRLRFAPGAVPQRQAAVKLHRDFSSHRGSPDLSPACGFRGPRAGTAGTSLAHSCTSAFNRQGIWLP